MLTELIIAFMFGIVVTFFIVQRLDKRKLKKLQGGYNHDDDPGRKIELNKGMGYRGSGKDSPREPELQSALEHAKQELLSSKVSGGDDNVEPIPSDTKLNFEY